MKIKNLFESNTFVRDVGYCMGVTIIFEFSLAFTK